jgi:DNA replication protein
MKKSGFIGFPDARMKPVIVPDFFFTDLLPFVDDLAELKLTLHCFWLLNEQEGELRYLRGDDLRDDQLLLDSVNLESDLRTPLAALEDALQRAVARGTLLKLEIETDDLIRQGTLSSQDLAAAIPEQARLKVERPNVFILYEQNIGFMTPMIAEQLRDMEKTYPPAWVEEAFEIAVSRNKRALRYIQAILKRWETEGKDSENNEESGRDSESQRRKYRPDGHADYSLG